MRRVLLTFLTVSLALSLYSQDSYINRSLPVDTTVKSGRLPNGMTYFVKYHNNPKGHGEFFIVHNVGALQEENNQNGLAHFLEHMAFNGTTHFPGKSMLEYLNKIGVRFGYNVNAYTSKERTVYNISNVPLERESVVDSVLQMISDWSGSISCLPEEIEKERGVIREEWRRGDDVRSRMYKQTYALQYKGSKYAERDVIGDTAVINNFKPDALTSFYHKWYRPDMQAIVVVGDFDTEKMIGKIKNLFSKIPEAKIKTPKEIYRVPDFDKPIVGFISDPETRSKAVKVIYKHDGPIPAEKLTTASVRQGIIQTMVANMMGAKFEISRNEPDPDFSTAVAVATPGSADKWFLQVTVSPVGNDYKRAFKGTFTDIERIKEYGFSAKDLVLAKTQMFKKIENNSKKLSNLRSEDFVSIIIDNFTKGEALTTPEERIKAEREVLKSITLDEVNEAMRSYLRDENKIFVLNCPQQDLASAPDADEIVAMAESAGKGNLAPFTTTAVKDNFWSFDNLKPGKIVKEEKNEKYQSVIWTLSNGIKVYYSYINDSLANLSVNANSDGGFVRVKEEDLPSAKMFKNISRYKALGNLDINDTKQFLKTKSAGITADISLYNENVVGSSSKKERELLMQMLYLAFTNFGLPEEGYKKMMEVQRSNFEKAPADYFIYLDSMSKVKFGSRIASQIGSADLDKISYEKMKRVFGERFGNPADFRFFLSGNDSPEIIKPLIEKYIASLPTNKNFEKPYAGSAIVVKGKRELKFFTKTALTPISKISLLYHGKCSYTSANYISSVLLRHILTDRYLQSVREEKGGTYYVGVDAYLSGVSKKNLSLAIDFDTDPKLRDELVEIIDAEMNDIIKNGVKDEEFNAALLFVKKSFAEASVRKTYLYERFTDLIENGTDLRDGAESLLYKVKPSDIQNLLSELIQQGNRLYFVYGTN